jgi:hypothetical protein
MTEESVPESQWDETILGLSTSQLAGLTVDELLNNKTAITMVLHYYRQLTNDNISLKNETNTLRTYVDSYERKKTYAKIASTLLAASNLLVGLGVEYFTPSINSPGVALLLGGILFIGIGLYFSFME